MIRHTLHVMGGNQLRPEVDDFQVMHVFYRLDTEDVDSETNVVISSSTTGHRMVGLENWDINNRVPGANVTKELLEQWVAAKVNLEELKATNISNLKPLPK